MNLIARMMKRYIKMPLKYALPLLFIGALVIASTTGCVTTAPANITIESANQASPVSTAYPKAGKSELLQAIVAYENESVWSRWDEHKITWINNTAFKLEGKTTGYGGSLITTTKATFIHFPTIAAASAYFDSLRPQYPQKPSSTSCSLYSLVTGHDATVIRQVDRYGTVGSDDVTSSLTQCDVLVTEASGQHHEINQA
jgi:hypothetical protein